MPIIDAKLFEQIHKLTFRHVSGSELLVSSEYIYNHFSDCVDKGYYLCSDKIHDIISIPSRRKEGENFRAILACNDGALRILEVLCIGNFSVMIFIKMLLPTFREQNCCMRLKLQVYLNVSPTIKAMEVKKGMKSFMGLEMVE